MTLFNRQTVPPEGTYLLYLKKEWELADGTDEPPVDSVRVVLIPFAAGVDLDDLLLVDGAYDVQVELTAENDW